MTKRLRLALAALAMVGLLGGGCAAYPAYPTYGYGYGYPGPYASGGYLAVDSGWHGGGWHDGWYGGRHHGWHGGGWHHGWHGGGSGHGWHGGGRNHGWRR